MTIDEMINHFEEVAKQRQERADALKNTTEFGSAECQKSADDCKQLAEWLKELKGYKKAYTEIDSKIECDYMGNNEYEMAVSDGYQGAINIIDRCIEEVNADED